MWGWLDGGGLSAGRITIITQKYAQRSFVKSSCQRQSVTGCKVNPTDQPGKGTSLRMGCIEIYVQSSETAPDYTFLLHCLVLPPGNTQNQLKNGYISYFFLKVPSKHISRKHQCFKSLVKSLNLQIKYLIINSN